MPVTHVHPNLSLSQHWSVHVFSFVREMPSFLFRRLESLTKLRQSAAQPVGRPLSMLVRVQKARLRPLRGSSPRPPNKAHLLALPRGSKPWFPLVRVCPTAASVVWITALLFALVHYGASEEKNCHLDGVAPRGTTVGSG